MGLNVTVLRIAGPGEPARPPTLWLVGESNGRRVDSQKDTKSQECLSRRHAPACDPRRAAVDLTTTPLSSPSLARGPRRRTDRLPWSRFRLTISSRLRERTRERFLEPAELADHPRRQRNGGPLRASGRLHFPFIPTCENNLARSTKRSSDWIFTIPAMNRSRQLAIPGILPSLSST